jgi:hypothetical protein
MKLFKCLSVLFLLTLFTFSANAQSAWSGFFSPITKVLSVEHPKIFYSESAKSGQILTATAPGDSMVWKFRPSLQLTGVCYQLNTPYPLAASLSSAGVGIEYGKFTSVNGIPYCNYSFNANLLTKITYNSQTTTGFGAAITANVFNNEIGIGAGYLGTTGFQNGHMVLITTFSYSF